MALFEDKYYNSVRPYMPQDAKRILDEQIPVIKQQVSAEIEAFGKSYAESVTTEVARLVAEIEKDLSASTESLKATTDELLKESGDSAKLKEEVEKLKKAVEAHEEQVRGWGETLNASLKIAAKTAAASVGLPPLPF